MALRLIPAPIDGTALAAETRRLLTSLAVLHERLMSLAQLAVDKIAAMRRADVAALDLLATQEATELESLRSCEAEREAILAAVAQQLPDCRGLQPRLADLAGLLPEPFASQIRAKYEGLRSAARKLKEKNRLVADVAHGLHAHIRGVFADLASANQETVVYGRTGRHDQRVTRSWVDAVG